MLRPPLLALAALAAVSATAWAPAAWAGDYKVGSITVQSPWSRPAQAGMNGVGFMTLVNTGAKPVTLTAIESPLAAKVELHQSSMANGVMTMRRQDTTTLAAGGKLELSPGGYHLMLLGLKQPLKVGQKAPLTLVFADGQRVTVDLTVRLTPPNAATGGMMDHQHP
ncbi:MAG: copper chaperone PCu(A)C [Alphaproteobacteria bacterium]|nr:copper chaperone PCu(A)C [Alphaproteobacteria bacterium]